MSLHYNTIQYNTLQALRERYIMPEQRSSSVNITRMFTMVISIIILKYFHSNQLLILSINALLCGIAAYSQHEMVTLHSIEGSDYDDFEKDTD